MFTYIRHDCPFVCMRNRHSMCMGPVVNFECELCSHSLGVFSVLPCAPYVCGTGVNTICELYAHCADSNLAKTTVRKGFMPQSNRLCCFCTNPEYEGSLNGGYQPVCEYISHTGDFRTAPLRGTALIPASRRAILLSGSRQGC